MRLYMLLLWNKQGSNHHRQDKYLLFVVLVFSLLTQYSLAEIAQAAPSFTSQQKQHKKAVETISNEIQPLTKDTPRKHFLQVGKKHRYQVALTTNQFTHILVRNYKTELVIRVFAQNNKQIIEIYTQDNTKESEPIFLVADAETQYQIEIEPADKIIQAVPYEIVVEALDSATPQNRNQAKAQQLFTEAETLRKDGKKEPLNQSIPKYQEVLPIFHALNDPYGEADVFHRMGLVFYALGDKEKALNYYNQALPLRKATANYRGQTSTLNGIGLIYDSVGEKSKALEYYNEALQLTRVTHDKFSEIRTLHNMGLVYNSIGEKQKALDCYKQGLVFFRERGNFREEALSLNNIGLVYNSLGERQIALDYYSRALQLRRKVGDSRGEAITLNNMGLVYHYLQEEEKAINCYQQSLEIARKVGDRKGEANTLNNFGLTYNSKGDNQKALEYYNQSLPLRKSLSDQRGEATVLHNIGTAYDDLGDKSKAIEYYNQSLSLKKTVGDRNGQAHTLYKLAYLQRDAGNFSTASTTIQEAIKLVELVRTSISIQDLRTSYLSTVQDYYDFYIDLLMKMHKENPSSGFDATALKINEQAHARSLLDLLTEARAELKEGIDPKLLEQEKTLLRQIDEKEQYRLLLFNAKSKEAQFNDTEKALRELISQYQDLEGKIKTTNPKYASVTQPSPISVKEIQQLLDDNTVLLEYFLGNEHSYLWVVTSTTLNSFELPKRSDIETIVKTFYVALTAPSVHPKNETFKQRLKRLAQAKSQYPNLAEQLSQLLLGQINSPLENKRLLIIADGVLQYIPFAALPVPSRTNIVPLAKEHEILNLPSAATLVTLRTQLQERTPVNKTIAVLADPVFEKDDPRLNSTNNIQKTDTTVTRGKIGQPKNKTLKIDFNNLTEDSGIPEDDLIRLLSSRQEAYVIDGLGLPSSQYKRALGFEANRTLVTSGALAKYRIVHFGTHGLLNTVNPELSCIVLSLFDKHGRPQNGFLRLQEIYNLNLPCELVVLSACRTGLGKKVRGEGLVGLTRGFMYAGTARVMASLWTVDDVATSEFMKYFYAELLGKKHLSPAAALRAAQLSMMRQQAWKSPYYWAGFILQGDYK